MGNLLPFRSLKSWLFCGKQERPTTSGTPARAPKLIAELGGSAKRLTLGKTADWCAYNGGVRDVMFYLRQHLGRPLVPELTELLSKYFRSSRRRAQETMHDYITRKCEVYMRARQSLHRVQQHQPGGGPQGGTSVGAYGSWSGSWPRSQWYSPGRRTSVESSSPTQEQQNRTTGTTRAAGPTSTTEEGSETSATEGLWSAGSWQWGSWTWHQDEPVEPELGHGGPSKLAMVRQCDDPGGMDQGGSRTSPRLRPGLVPAQRCQPGGGERFLAPEGGSGIEGPMVGCRPGQTRSGTSAQRLLER